MIWPRMHICLLEFAPSHPEKKKWAIGWKLTLECGHQHVSIFDEVFNEPVGPLQLDLMALESLPELRTVQERITKLERRKPHGDRNLHSRLLEWIQVRYQSFWDWGGNSYPLRNFEILLESWWEGSPALFFSCLSLFPLHNFRTLQRRSLTERLSLGYKNGRLFRHLEANYSNIELSQLVIVPSADRIGHKPKVKTICWWTQLLIRTRRALNEFLLLWERETPAGACWNLCK